MSAPFHDGSRDLGHDGPAPGAGQPYPPDPPRAATSSQLLRMVLSVLLATSVAVVLDLVTGVRQVEVRQAQQG